MKLVQKMITGVLVVACSTVGAMMPVQADIGVATKSVTVEKQPKVHAKAGIVIDANSGKILYEKNIDARHYPASITKILTTLVAIEHTKDFYEDVTFSWHAVNDIEPGSTNIGIKTGEKIPVREVLSGIMLESANEACNGIAEHTAGSVEAFVKMMNAKAKELGCTNSHFVTTNGLHDKNHYVTARDMATISRAALKNDMFRQVTCTSNSAIMPTNKDKKTKELWNHHKMVKQTMYNYTGVEGGKTGYTTKAGGTLVTFVKRGNEELICVLLKGHTYDLYKDTVKVMNFAYKNYRTIELFADLKTKLETTDAYAQVLETGNKIVPYELPLKNLGQYTVLLRNDQSTKYLTYESHGKKIWVCNRGTKLGEITLKV